MARNFVVLLALWQRDTDDEDDHEEEEEEAQKEEKRKDRQKKKKKKIRSDHLQASERASESAPRRTTNQKPRTGDRSVAGVRLRASGACVAPRPCMHACIRAKKKKKKTREIFPVR